MKKMVILIGLLVLSVLVIGCTQGETLAGQASGPSLAAGETRCDGRDDNRNRLIDEGCDDDGDKYCDSSMTLVGTPRVCPNGGGDCQDTNNAFHPGATDECTPTSVDLNCDGTLSCTSTTSGTQCEGWISYCDTLLVGESKDYTIGSTNYNIAFTDMLYQSYDGGIQSATFDITTGGGTAGDTYTIFLGETVNLWAAVGGTLTVTNMLYQDYAGGVHSATFCLNP